MAFLYLRGPYKKDDKKEFLNSTTVKDSKLKWGRFRLNIKKKIFIMRLVKLWKMFSRMSSCAWGLVASWDRTVTSC